MPRSAASPSHGFLITLAVLLAVLHAVLAVTATTDKSMTADEIAHLTAGHAYNTRADYRLQPENGNLPQRLAALPMSIAAVPLPPASLETWQIADVWKYGHTFFFERGILADQWLFLGRAMIALVSAATALLVFFWSRALFGWRGGFLSLALYIFCPTFLAHGALATSDIVMTFCFVASVWAWWRHLERPGFTGAAVSAVVLGVAFVAKFSAPLLPLMLALIGLAWAAGERHRSGWHTTLLRLARTTLGHALVAWAIIWLFYGFRHSPFSPMPGVEGTFHHGWGWTLMGLGLPAKVIWRLNEWRVFPEAWLYGLAFVVQYSRVRAAFMSGDYSITGWITFFPFTFLVKTTLPLLLLLAGGMIAGIIGLVRKIKARVEPVAIPLRPFIPLAVLFAVYWATSLASHLNIGHRHIMPTYPVLFIAAGALGRWINLRQPLVTLCIVGIVIWHAGESFRIRPHYLAYFNQIVGGPQNGWRHLADSSLDWGQDLPGLKRWLTANAGDTPVFLSYFGTGDPAYEGIKAIELPRIPEPVPTRPWHALTPGIYALGATMLQHVYSGVRGAWTIELEKEFQQLRVLEPALLSYQKDPVRRAALLRDAPANYWTATWKRYEEIRFARLCHYLRARNPDAAIGYSILIFRVDATELKGAVGGTLDEWRQLIEWAVAQRNQPVNQ